MNNSGADAALGCTVDRQSNTIRLERHLNAPSTQVFDAWTQPERLAAWWDPAGERLAACEIDLRVGGSFRFVSRGAADRPFSGVYREIVPPCRLVFDAMGATGRVTLEDVEGGTRMLVEIVCPSKEHFEQFVKMGVHVGTSKTLDNLVDHVGEAVAPVE